VTLPEPVPPDIAAALARVMRDLQPLGTPFYWYSDVSSTNDVAASLADQGAPEGALVAANAQSAGRGRHGRAWASPAGAGLYVSAVLRPRADMTPLLTIAAGVALAEGVERATGLRVDLKWPNDLCVGARKVAGVLAEARSAPSAPAGAAVLQFVIIGFGINVLQASYPPHIASRATSLEDELGRMPDRGLVLAECLQRLAARYRDLSSARGETIVHAWRSRASGLTGRSVRLSGARVEDGVVEGIDEDGALLVRVGGRVTRIISSEVTWL
jgi:BirA family biotin operon repressor/biotin-[acetyl-CoA-carboxylase] ligase